MSSSLPTTTRHLWSIFLVSLVCGIPTSCPLGNTPSSACSRRNGEHVFLPPLHVSSAISYCCGRRGPGMARKVVSYEQRFGAPKKVRGRTANFGDGAPPPAPPSSMVPRDGRLACPELALLTMVHRMSPSDQDPINPSPSSLCAAFHSKLWNSLLWLL